MAAYENLKDRALSLFENRRYDECAVLFRTLSSSASDSDECAAALIYESKCLEALGRFSEARDCLAEARKLGDSSREYQARLDLMEAGIDAREGNDEVALSKLNRLLGSLADLLKDPEYRDIYEGIQLLRAGRLQNMKRPGEALPLFLESKNFTIEMPEEHLYRMAYCLAQCGHGEQGEAVVRNAMEGGLDISTECMARYYLGAIYAAEKEHGKALKEFQFCEKHLDQSHLWIPSLMESMAYAYENLGLPEEAARYLQMAGSKPPGSQRR